MPFVGQDDLFRALAGDPRVLGDDNFRRAPGGGGPTGDPTIGPVASGSVLDQTFNRASGDRYIATRGAFTGDGMTFSISPSVAGVSILAPTGVVTVETGAVIADTEFTVTATNLGGSAQITFNIEVVAKAPEVIGTISDRVYSVATGPHIIEGSSAISAEAATWTIESGGSVASINPTTGRVTVDADEGAAETTVTILATNSGGFAETSFTVEVVVAAPVAIGTILPRAYIEGTGDKDIDIRPKFGGDLLQFAITANPGGIGSFASPGILRISTDSVIAAGTIEITASNSAGTARQSFTVEVSLAPPVVVGSVPDQILTIGQGSGSVSVSVAGVITGTSAILSILPSGAGVTISGTTVTIDTSALISQATYTLTGTNAAGSAGATFLVAVNDVAPAVVGSPGPQTFTLGSGDQAIDLTPFVVGENLAWTRAIGGDRASVAPNGTATIKADQILNSYTVAFDATNSGGTVRVSFTVTVAPAAPVKTSDVPPLVFFKNQAATYDLSQHVSGLNLTYTRTSAQGLISSIGAATGLLTANVSAAAGPTSHSVAAGNDTSSVTLTFTIEVELVAPAVVAAIPDQSFDLLSGQRTVQASLYFSGEELAYSITAGGPAATVNATTGAITLKDDAVRDQWPVTVRATNSTSFAEISFLLTVTEVVSGEIRPPNGGVIGMRAGVDPGVIIVCWNAPTFWGDVSAGDAAGTAGNLRVTVGGRDYYMLDGPVIPNAEIGADLVVNFSAPNSDIPIDTVRGLPVGSGAVGQSVVVGPVPATLDTAELDGAVCNRWTLPAALHGQTVPVTFVWYNAQGVETDPVTVDITTEIAGSVPANALRHPVNDNHLSLPTSDTDLLLHPVD